MSPRASKEAGLHYNWHRAYDPTLGRYTQPDPLGFIDGPGVFAYVRNKPFMLTDKTGLNTVTLGGQIGGATCGPGCAGIGMGIGAAILIYQCFKKEKDKEKDDDDEKRCEAIIRGCKQGCTDIYVDDPDSLPGSGRNLQPRWVRCVKQCAKSYGCSY